MRCDILSRKGQMKLSFGMIFSIFLIIIFLTFAFYGIKKFVDLGNNAQEGKFKNDLQMDIDKIWKGSQGSDRFEYALPSKIKYVCFADFLGTEEGKGAKASYYDELNQVYFGYENMFFYPVGSSSGLDSTEIKHINLEEIVSNENPYCIPNEDGRVSILISKNYGENLVKISR